MLTLCFRRHAYAFIVLSLATGATTLSAHADTFTDTYLAPGVQTPAGITSNYETFNSPTYVGGNLTTNFAGSSVTGTYTGGYQVYGANIYGGAGGTGNYLEVVGANSYTLTLSKGQNYLGLWFSALDVGNELQFYNGTNLVQSFLPSNFAALVGACPTAAPEPNFCGNPNSDFFNQNSGQQYAYLNFYDTSGTFNRIVFTETVPGYGFESDNHAVAMLSPGTPVVGTPIGATPEPSSIALLGTGLLAAGKVLRRRRA